MSKNVKLKSLLEGYAWERNPQDFGKPLPTLEDIQTAYQAKQDITEADGSMTINDFNDIFETFYTSLEANAKFMQEDTLKTLEMAIKLLHKAEAQEAEAHGVNFNKRTIKLK
jgi:hypothetical protein